LPIGQIGSDWVGERGKDSGYESWSALCADQFQVRVQFSKAERVNAVTEMTHRGMSTRAIGAALGLDQKTVVNDRRQSTDESSSVEVRGLARLLQQ
jgi:hypothetical protein